MYANPFIGNTMLQGYPNEHVLDNDFYKFAMTYFIRKFYPETEVTFELINRDMAIPLADVVPEHALRAALDHKRARRFGRREADGSIAYLRGMRMHAQVMFDEEFFDFLESFELPPYELAREGSQYRLRTTGPWERASNWEIPFMQIPVELYYRELLGRMTPIEREILFSRAKDLLFREYAKLANSPFHPKIMLFGARRRMSYFWEQFVTALAIEVLGPQLIGTSNVHMAREFNLMPMGTNAHELQMVASALAPPMMKVPVQYQVLFEWEKLFGTFLRICLPDTFGTAQFLRNAPDWLVEWRGFRDDSGDTFENIERYIAWYKDRGIADPKAAGKLIILSDGLTADRVLEIAEAFDSRINLSYGMGTNLSNLFVGCHPTPDRKVPGLDLTWEEAFRSFSIVAKATEANGKPVVKLSNNIKKATGPADAIREYAEIFGHEGRIDEKVSV